MKEANDDKHGIRTAAKAGEATMDTMTAAISKTQLERFNSDLIAAGLRPECVADLMPITIQLGHWMGRNLRKGVPLNLAIAEMDEVAGSPIETLLAACTTNEERVHTIMIDATLRALALCCEEGRVVEAATFIIQTTYSALDEAGATRNLPAS